MEPLVLSVLICAVQASTSFGLPPYFTNEPHDTIIYRNNLVLNCAAQGDPSPSITWYRGDPPALVSDGHVINGSLVIANVVEGVDASRGGIPYHCTATSSGFGTIRSKTAVVYYAYFDGFHDRGDNITYNVSIPSIAADRDNIALYCNISGANPPPSILWVDDFNQTMPNDGVMFLYLDAGRYLAIININAETAKRVFHCRVTNVLGLMTLDSPTQYRFNISTVSRSGLVIYKPFQDITAYEGDTNLQFSMIAASGDPVTVDYAITSLPPGSLLKGRTMTKQNSIVGLLPGNVSTNDSGTVVRCKVFTAMGTASYYATLTVLARANLIMTSSPADSLDNVVGTNVSFTCEARGVNLTTRWYRNGEQVTPSSHVVIAGFKMTINGLLEEDSGLYQCSVSNGTSSVWRQWSVVVREPKLVSRPIEDSELVVDNGTGITLTMQVMSYPPPDHVQWYMNGSQVEPSGLYLVSNISVSNASTDPITYSASLTISSVNLTTLGFYWATFYVHSGVVNSSTVFVTPPVPAHVLGLNIPTCLEAGKSVQLICEVYGYPAPTIHFFKDNSSIVNNGRIVAAVNILTIADIQPDDSGVYSCSADNGDVDHSNGFELFYCLAVSKNVSNFINSSKVAWSTSPTIISVVVVSLVVAVVVTMVTVAMVIIWCYRRLNSKHCSVDINEHYKDNETPYNLSHRESSVELLNHRPPVETIVPMGVYETVGLPSKKPCSQTNEPRDVPQLPHNGNTTAVKIINVTYSLPDMSMKMKGQDPSTIVRVKAPMGDFYTVPEKKKVLAASGHEQSESLSGELQTLSGSAGAASPLHTNDKMNNQDPLSNAQGSSTSVTSPMNHLTITPQTGEVYTVQIIDSDSQPGKEIF
ncbi:hypothetical protein EMCRGX_G015432 [Ephydatia muelleri]